MKLLKDIWKRVPQGERRRMLGLVLIFGAFIVVHFLPFVVGLVFVCTGCVLYVSTIRFLP